MNRHVTPIAPAALFNRRLQPLSPEQKNRLLMKRITAK
jgi:hypothetical protein